MNALSLWRRLIGTGAEQKQDAGDDRRIWVRHPADLETTLKSAHNGSADRLSARVRDISRGGVSLVVSRKFKVGELLSVELPKDGATHEVLACIVRCEKANDKEWSVGCTFSSELSDDELQGFGARRRPHDPADNRRWVRYECDVHATYELITAAGEKHPAQVLNISASGVGLVVSRHVEPGALLNVELQSPEGKTLHTMLACVVHVNPRSNSQFALGCNFIRELSEEDLEQLIARQPA